MERNERYNRDNEWNRNSNDEDSGNNLSDHLRTYHDDYNSRSNRNDNFRGQDNSRERDRNNEDLSEFKNRYSRRGNYYGMSDQNYEYRNVKSQGNTYDNSSGGPVGGYGAGSYPRDNSNDNSRSYDYNRTNRSGNGGDRHKSDESYNSQGEHYRYGDPNPYMGNDRNGGYERSRGTGWDSGDRRSNGGSSDMNYSRSSFESQDGRNRGGISRTGSNPNSNDTYARQDNSYRSGGSGRRVSDFSMDESNNKGRSTDNRHIDRGDWDHKRSDNNYGRDFNNYNASDYELRKNEVGSRRDRDNYAQGNNRADKGSNRQNKDEDLFDNSDNNYPNRSTHGDRHKSGPDWSARSPISDYDRNNARGKTE